MMNEAQKRFELDYFQHSHVDDNNRRQEWIIEKWRLPRYFAGSVIEIGTGPYCGVLAHIESGTAKISIDPLWREYAAAGFRPTPGVVTMNLYAEEVQPTERLCEAILCFNVLEHGQDPSFRAIETLSRQIVHGGRFYLCQSLRSEAQCNEAHIRPMRLEELREVIQSSGMDTVREWMEPRDPPMFDYPMIMGVYQVPRAVRGESPEF